MRQLALLSPVVLASFLVVCAIVLGGGGTPNPITEILLELIAAAVALLWLGPGTLRRPVQPPAAATSPYLVAITALIVAIPLLQLIPLPAVLWQALPGRQDEVAALALIGADHDWRAWSLSPARTLAALLSLGPPLFLMLLVASLGVAERGWIVATVAVMGLISALLGAAQLAGGRGALRLYVASHDVWVNGFHANRNAVVDVLLIALVAAAAAFHGFAARRAGAAQQGPSGSWIAYLAGSAVLLLAAGLTGSRMGIALAPLALVAVGAIFLRGSGKPLVGQAGMGLVRGGKTARAGITAAIVIVGVAVFALRRNAAVEAVVARFTLTRDFRIELWSDTLFAISRYWPFGSGMGTFVPVAVAAERLEMVDQTMPNRAHNDYLELALEAGVFGIVALALVSICLAALALRAWRSRPRDRPQVIFALATLFIIGAHSVVDYPLRSMALTCLAGVAAGLLAPLPSWSAKAVENGLKS